MRIAIVDVGTNTTRLYIAEVTDNQITDTLTRTSRVTRLGAGVDASGRLAEESVAREHVVLEDYAAQIRTARVDRAVAVMTSAVRDAANGGEFSLEVASRYLLETHVLTGDAEAALTYRGATDQVDPDSSERILVVDIGGGSTELVLGRGITSDFNVSTQTGVVRQSDRHISGDEATPEELAALRADVDATLAAGVPAELRRGVQRTLAVAGTATSLAAIDMELDPYDPRRVHGYVLTREHIDRLDLRLRAMTLEQRRHINGLNPDRAPVIIPGVIILTAVMDLFGLSEVQASEHDLLRGAALHYAESD